MRGAGEWSWRGDALREFHKSRSKGGEPGENHARIVSS